MGILLLYLYPLNQRLYDFSVPYDWLAHPCLPLYDPLCNSAERQAVQPEKSRAAVYHLESAAGGVEKAESDAEAHDDARPAAL